MKALSSGDSSPDPPAPKKTPQVLQAAKAASPALDDPAGFDAKVLVSSQARRAALLALPWWTAEQVGQAFGSEAPSTSSQAASRLRAARALLGVWDGRRFMHPDFQFRDGHLTPRLEELLAVLPADDRNGWRRAIWLYAPNRRLKDRAPADVWQENPDAVIEAAREAYAARLVDF